MDASASVRTRKDAAPPCPKGGASTSGLPEGASGLQGRPGLPALVRAASDLACVMGEPVPPSPDRPPFSYDWMEARCDAFGRSEPALPAHWHPRLLELRAEALGSFCSSVLADGILLQPEQAKALLVETDLLEDLLDAGFADEWVSSQFSDRFSARLLGRPRSSVPACAKDVFDILVRGAARAMGLRLSADAEDELDAFLEERSFA